MKHLRSLLRAVAASALLATTLAVRADADSERESLARIAQELQHLEAMTDEAAKNADPTARVHFRYDWLRNDLELVRRGVVDHLDAPRQPRPVPPLTGDYRR